MAAPKGNTNSAGNIGGGRETDYKKSFAALAFKIALLGATDSQLADILGVSVRTVNYWKKNQPDFSQALTKGKTVADAEISHSLYQRAKGYSHPDVDIKQYEGTIIKTRITKHYPPDTTAAIFWLKNRRKNDWRDKHDIGMQLERMSDEDLDKVIAGVLSKASNNG